MVKEKNRAFRFTFYYGATIVFILFSIIVALVYGTLQRVLDDGVDKTNSQETVLTKKSD